MGDVTSTELGDGLVAVEGVLLGLWKTNGMMIQRKRGREERTGDEVGDGLQAIGVVGEWGVSVANRKVVGRILNGKTQQSE